MINAIMFKVHNVILRNRSAPEIKRLCTSVHGALTDAMKKYFNIYVTSKFVNHTAKITHVQSQQIEENCKKLLKYNVDPCQPYPLLRCIICGTNTLEHRICLLQELGVQHITVKDICMLPTYMRYNVDTFQEVCKFPIHVDIVANIVNSVDCPLAHVQEQLKLQTDVTLGHIYKICMSYHLSKNLGLPDEFFMRKVILLRKYRFYSFKIIKETLGILTNLLGFNVLEYPKALVADPDNIHSLLNCLKEIRLSGLTPEEIIHRYPKTLFLDPEYIRNNINILRSYGINEEKVFENLRIFKFTNKDECIRRLEILKKVPEIWIYKGHPLFLYVLVHIERCLANLEYIKTLRDDEIPIHFLVRHRSYIRRNEFSRYMKYQIMRNMQYILKGELKEHTEKALARIVEHPNFEHVKCTIMSDTVAYLREQFPAEVIARNGQIVLYPRVVLARALDIVRREYSAENGYHFPPDQYLELAQYLLEKSTGFSGDSIWYTEFPCDEYIPHLAPDYR